MENNHIKKDIKKSENVGKEIVSGRKTRNVFGLKNTCISIYIYLILKKKKKLELMTYHIVRDTLFCSTQPNTLKFHKLHLLIAIHNIFKTENLS